MEKFPEDFTAEALRNKLDGSTDKCLSKYREKIYNGFKCATTNYFEIHIDKDYSDYINHLMNRELRQVGLQGQINVRIEEYIVGGENDPEFQEFTERYLIIKPLKID
ncbi:putative orfan [Tupanvirus soda lake]|uniref:Orfan n=2 Tax=Tupanvirus TaxID=2094720 RepID=A0AC62AAL2_9VIRU|nr:putative orfan [Tupanvirus soda lake]QKU34821.1 putative orfan [Tupanvirus soda lake]